MSKEKEEAERKEIEREISELRTPKKKLLENARPYIEELNRHQNV